MIEKILQARLSKSTPYTVPAWVSVCNSCFFSVSYKNWEKWPYLHLHPNDHHPIRQATMAMQLIPSLGLARTNTQTRLLFKRRASKVAARAAARWGSFEVEIWMKRYIKECQIDIYIFKHYSKLYTLSYRNKICLYHFITSKKCRHTENMKLNEIDI